MLKFSLGSPGKSYGMIATYLLHNIPQPPQDYLLCDNTVQFCAILMDCLSAKVVHHHHHLKQPN